MYLYLQIVSTIQKVSGYLNVTDKKDGMGKINGKELPSEAQCKATLNSVADALYVIGGKWKLRIIVALKDGNKRFNELQRVVDGISAKVLSTELKDLELNGFVRRNVFTGTPVVVEYELSDYADTLDDVLYSLSEWGAMHRENVKKSMRKKKTVIA
jgi:DNA-binding HxlR family transcriptional regulator